MKYLFKTRLFSSKITVSLESFLSFIMTVCWEMTTVCNKALFQQFWQRCIFPEKDRGHPNLRDLRRCVYWWSRWVFVKFKFVVQTVWFTSSDIMELYTMGSRSQKSFYVVMLSLFLKWTWKHWGSVRIPVGWCYFSSLKQQELLECCLFKGPKSLTWLYYCSDK